MCPYLAPLQTSGFSGDCAVNFVNGVEQAQVFQGLAFVQFSRIGPVEFTECQLDGGQFVTCKRYKLV